MQQHTGEHILSGLINATFGYHNVGFHVGKEVMEVDFSGPMTLEQALALEAKANEAVWANLPIRCWVPSPEVLPQVAYRTKRPLPWPVRIVEVPGYDRCACCGVHVERTGEVGIIKIVSVAKFHEGVRLGMLCGKRAYEYLGQVFEQNRMVSQAFSAKMPETGNAAQRMNEALAAEKFRAAGLEKRLFGYIAETYRGKVDVVHFEDGLTSAGVRELADAIAAVCTGTSAVLSGTEGNFSVCLVNKNADIKELGTAMNKALNGDYDFEVDWVPMPRGPKMDVNTGMCALTGWGIGITSANPTAAANFIKMSCEMEAAFANKNNTVLYGEEAVAEMNELAARSVFVPIGIDKYWDNNWTVFTGLRTNEPVVNFLTNAEEQVKSGFESTMSN
jgi:alanyl-tRNA synthetase